MHIQKLKIAQFKNHRNSTFEFDEGVNCIYGPNGVGKTNVLDAIYFLCTGRSYFTRIDQQSIPFDTEFARFQGLFVHDEVHEHTIVLREAGKKTIEINKDVISKMSDFVGRVPVVMIAPADISLVVGSGEERRRLMDRTLSMLDHAYLKALQKHNRLLLMRNELLKKFAKMRHADLVSLEAIDHQLSPEVAEIYEKRKAFCEILSEVTASLYTELSGNQESVSLEYQSDLPGPSWSEIAGSARQTDLFAARTTAGLHKDDLILNMEGREVKKFASQGQIKTMTIALNLATFIILRQQKQTVPILLLDDIYEKIDDFRATKLMDIIAGNGYGQVLITDTSESRMRNRLKGLAGAQKFFNIEARNSGNIPSL